MNKELTKDQKFESLKEKYPKPVHRQNQRADRVQGERAERGHRDHTKAGAPKKSTHPAEYW